MPRKAELHMRKDSDYEVYEAFARSSLRLVDCVMRFKPPDKVILQVYYCRDVIANVVAKRRNLSLRDIPVETEIRRLSNPTL